MTGTWRLLASISIGWLIFASYAEAQSSGLADLTRVQPGRSRRVSSAAPTPGSNYDNCRVEPGDTRILADVDGPGTITHIWLTFSEAQPNWISKDGSADPSEIVLRMYWDGAEQPAVEAPLGDFFAAGFGLRNEINSVPMQVEGGDGYNCFWPMPFFKHARVTITNESERRLNSFYYHIDYTAEQQLPPETAYFCAQYRQEMPEQLGRDYLVLDAEGQGHYVGTVLSARSRSPEWFGEGDDKFYVDGEEEPSIWGTGTEDYFLCAWGMNECSFPYFGCTYMDGEAVDLGVRYTIYRWHVADPIRFTKSLRFELEHKGWMSADETESGKVEGHVEREDDIATVAFWYQIGQPKRFTTLPPAKERVFPNLDLIIEGKTLLETARHSAGEIVLQPGNGWTGAGQIFFRPSDEKAYLEFDFNVEKQEPRGLFLRLTHSYDYGKYQVQLDGAKVGEPIDLYAAQTETSDRLLGLVQLEPGKHTIRLESAGRNVAATGNFLGVDSVRLRERWSKQRPALKPQNTWLARGTRSGYPESRLRDAGCSMDLWTALLDVIVLLAAALLLGALCERLKQSALLGYLLAGTLLGPNALNWMPSHKAVATLSELGATLLLFSIGLEFSWRRLRGIGPIALVGGTLQIVITSAVVAGVCAAFGLEWRAALAVGALASLSSTACVLRLLISRAEIDSIHGRHALGILLLQDIAVVPLVLFVTVLGQGGSISRIGGEIVKVVGAALLLTATMFILLKYIVPLIVTTAEAARNRELPILLAIATALGAAWAAHYSGLSPMLGAFIAGMLLAESPYAVQIRADVSPLRTLFVTLFFSSIGMVADPAWVLDNLALVATAVAIVIFCKAAVVLGVTRAFRSSLGHAVATAVCLAQIGEFSFVLAGVARDGGLVDDDLFKLIMSATIGTLFLTPYLVSLAPRLMMLAGQFTARGRIAATATESAPGDDAAAIKDRIVIVGFGPAGQRVAEALIGRYRERLTIVELNSKSAAVARGYGLRIHIGDATRTEVLEHLHVGTAAAVIVTLPDPTAGRQVIQHVRAMSPATPVFARARYHIYRWELMLAGAEVVVDEEDEVGVRIAKHVRRKLRGAGQ